MMLLTHVGLGFFACSTEKEYVTKAVALAGQLDSLAKIRQTLRDRLRASPLLDKRRIASQLEEKYRLIWQRWCREQTSRLQRINTEKVPEGQCG